MLDLSLAQDNPFATDSSPEQAVCREAQFSSAGVLVFLQCNLDLVLLNILLSAFNSSVDSSTLPPTVSFVVSSLGRY